MGFIDYYKKEKTHSDILDIIKVEESPTKTCFYIEFNNYKGISIFRRRRRPKRRRLGGINKAEII